MLDFDFGRLKTVATDFETRMVLRTFRKREVYCSDSVEELKDIVVNNDRDKVHLLIAVSEKPVDERPFLCKEITASASEAKWYRYIYFPAD